MADLRAFDDVYRTVNTHRILLMIEFCRQLSFARGVLPAFLVLGCLSLNAPSAPSEQTGVVARAMHYNGNDYPFAVYVPSTYKSGTALPALLLVHGAGGNGWDFIENWRAFAEAKRIILVAPTLDESAAAETQVPQVFPRIMDTVQSEWSVDPKRRYLFGYSAGGYFVYDAALLNADYFAAAGVFAAVIQPDYDGIVSEAKRKTAIAIYLGDRDPYFTFAQGRRTRDLLVAGGIDVHYVELPNQDHNYPAASASVNADVWKYLEAHPLR